jgi:small-conductance mechanosensitive channel/CRP-like cAMP-binding protein
LFFSPLFPAYLSISVVPLEFCLLVVALGNIRIYIGFLVNVLLARKEVPRILGEVGIALSLIVFALIRMDAVGVNLAAIFTTSAFLTAVVAFSLQATLGNLWGGIALQLDNTCRIGDWIQIEGVLGQVVGIRWRYTSIATNRNETIIIPNSMLVNNRVTLLARRGDTRIPWRRTVEFAIGYEWPPSRVIAAVAGALSRVDIPNVASMPAPSCILSSFDTSTIRYVVRYWLTDLSDVDWNDSQVRLHAFAALAREGMEIPIPRNELFINPAGDVRDKAAVRERDARIALLKSLELFAPLTDPERAALAAELHPTPFVPGDIPTRQGETADSLYILARGNVGIFRDTAEGDTTARKRLATLTGPGYFGEMGLLTGQPRTATIVAESEVLCYRLDKAGFETIIRARPELAQSLSQTVAERQAANDATLASLSAEARARATGTRAMDIVRRIQQFFGL